MEPKHNKIINDLNSMTQNINNKETTYDLSKEEISKIKKKFKELKLYEYKKPTELEIDMMIRYTDRDLDKLSIIGIVKHIEYYSAINKNRVKTIFLYDIYTEHKTKWKVNPKNIYIFQVKRPQKSKLERVLEKIIGSDFDEITSQDQINVEFFDEELRKFKEGNNK